MIDPVKLAYVEHPRPDERAVLLLASVYNDVESKRAAVSWDDQVRASVFFNENGLARTLDEIVRLGGIERLQP